MGPESLGELLNTKDILLLKLYLDGRLARNYVRCRMQSSTLRKRNPFVLICWSLVLALLLGQSYALAHDHDADHASETSCTLCLYAQLSDEAVPTDSGTLSGQCCLSGVGHLFGQQPSAVRILSFHSRAPPSTC
jgi:hypothetical protein